MRNTILIHTVFTQILHPLFSGEIASREPLDPASLRLVLISNKKFLKTSRYFGQLCRTISADIAYFNLLETIDVYHTYKNTATIQEMPFGVILPDN